jgi:ATP-dependent helicase/nuclease subunit A
VLFRSTKDTITNPRTQIQEEEQRIASNENWNALYVAMTRAKQGLWISGVATSSAKEGGLDLNSWYHRIQLAELPDFAISGDIATAPNDQTPAAQSQGNTNNSFSIDDFVIEWDVAKSSHALQLTNIESGTVKTNPVEDPVEAELDTRILEDGVYFHALLEYCTLQSGSTISDLPSLTHTMNWLGIDEGRATLAITRAKTVLETDALKPYLLNGDWVQAWNEIDVLIPADEKESAPDEQNQKTIHTRFDRLVEFADRLVILDYKLSLPEEGDRKSALYQKQLQQYASGLQRIRHDKPIEAYLVSAAGELQQVVLSKVA